MKIALIILGSLSLVLGVVGIFLPLLPTTPLLLLSAWAFFRSSDRLYDWLINHPHLGEYIRNFRQHRAIPLRVKIVSVSMVWLTIGYCIFCVVDKWWWAQLSLGVLAAAISWHILSYKTLKK
ncbi:MAG: YbaN family protein [Alistipes sp.]|nr:YbaN family protein [Alistipes sp.]